MKLTGVFRDVWIFQKEARRGGPNYAFITLHIPVHWPMRRLLTILHSVKVTYSIQWQANSNAYFILHLQHMIQLYFHQPLSSTT
jgi:hypothetical protein